MPEPSHLESKESQRRVVHGHSVIPEVSTHHRLQPFALFGNGFVHPSSKLGFHLVQLRLQPFADRLPQHRDRKSTRLNSSHGYISYAVLCLNTKNNPRTTIDVIA